MPPGEPGEDLRARVGFDVPVRRADPLAVQVFVEHLVATRAGIMRCGAPPDYAGFYRRGDRRVLATVGEGRVVMSKRELRSLGRVAAAAVALAAAWVVGPLPRFDQGPRGDYDAPRTQE